MYNHITFKFSGVDSTYLDGDEVRVSSTETTKSSKLKQHLQLVFTVHDIIHTLVVNSTYRYLDGDEVGLAFVGDCFS